MKIQNRNIYTNDYRTNVNPNSVLILNELVQCIFPKDNSNISREDVYPGEKYENPEEVRRGL